MFTAYSFGLSHVHWILTNILDMQVESELFICIANLLALMDIILYMNIGKVIKLQRLVTVRMNRPHWTPTVICH